MGQERGPYLPLDRVLVLAVEVLELERLLEFLEKQLDLPPGLVQVRYRRRGPDAPRAARIWYNMPND